MSLFERGYPNPFPQLIYSENTFGGVLIMTKIKCNCIQCETIVERYPSQILSTVYCSRKCRSDFHKEHHTELFNCHYCGKQKRIRKANFNYNGNNFCTRACKDKWQSIGLKGDANPFYNKSHSSETKLKVSITKKAAGLRGEKAHNYNTHPVECSECGMTTFKIQYLIDRSEHLFCSVECHGKWKSKNLTGENNPSWNPNLTYEERLQQRKYPEYYSFISGVMKRDNYTCDICGEYSKWGTGLNAHHLNSYDWDIENRTNIDNGITLCKTCHTDFHSIFGYGKNTKEQYTQYKMTKLKESV